MKKLFYLLILTGLFSLPTLADLLVDDQVACQGKNANDACSINGKDGVCLMKTRSRLDYSKGTPPSSVKYETLICEPVVQAGESGCSALPLSVSTFLPLLSLLLGFVLVGRLRRGKA